MLLYGKEARRQLQDEIRAEAARNHLRMVVIQIGEDEASQVYVRNIQKFGDNVGVSIDVFNLSAGNCQNQVVRIIEELNCDPGTTGIMLQRPIPDGFNADVLVNSIDPDKDVEGVHNCNLGKLISAKAEIKPATPKAVIRILKTHDEPIEGKRVTIVGRSTIVGFPLAAIMTAENATVTLCHTRTADLRSHVRQADIVVSAVGKANFILPDMINEDTVVIDAGINVDENGRICGDVHPEAAAKARKASAVPGGVGPITVAEIFDNLVILNRLKNK